MSQLTRMLIILFICSISNLTPKNKINFLPSPYLRNNLPSEMYQQFKAKIQTQAMQYPFSFYLASLEVIVHKKSDKPKQIALTFDDGPDHTYTEKVLEILRNHEVKATFFLVGQQMKSYPKLAKQIVAEKHALGNHSYSHAHFSKLKSKKDFIFQINKTSAVFKDQIGKIPICFRPPYGDITDAQIKYMQKKGFKVITWSVDSFDWLHHYNSPKKILETTLKYSHDGAILLLHSGGGNRNSTIKALPVIIQKLKLKGFEFVTVQKLLSIKEYFKT